MGSGLINIEHHCSPDNKNQIMVHRNEGKHLSYLLIREGGNLLN